MLTDDASDEELWVRRAGGHENTYGIRLGDERYLLTATAFGSPGRFRYGAVVETVVDADGRRWISKVVERSPYRSAMRLVSFHVIRSPRFEDLKAHITDVGGMWEQLLGGILVVHVPRDSGIDPRAEIDGLAAAVWRESGESRT